ncbi:hypothetical protein AOLI_G00081360 [Acnodon oligacanthus]
MRPSALEGSEMLVYISPALLIDPEDNKRPAPSSLAPLSAPKGNKRLATNSSALEGSERLVPNPLVLLNVLDGNDQRDAGKGMLLSLDMESKQFVIVSRQGLS